MKHANSFSLLVLILGVCSVLSAADPVLGSLNAPNPALMGFLGIPGTGGFLQEGPVWHRSGQIFALEHHRAGFYPLSIWKGDPKTLTVSRSAILNAGESWCASQGGDLVCAQSPRKDDEDIDPALNPAAWEPGAFGCFRLRDGVRLWKLPVRQNERVSGAAFTLDDKMVVILTVWSGQMSLRLLDATNGMLVRQHEFTGRRQEEAFRSTNLIMRPDEVWMADEEEQKTVLLRFPLATLQPVKVDCPPLDGFQGGVRLAPDGRHILLVGNGFAKCLGLVNGRWQPVYEDNDFNMIALGGPSGNFLMSAHFMPDGRSIVLASDDSARLTDLATKKTRRIKLHASHGVCPSPDGSYLLVQYDRGLEVVSVRETDMTDPARHRQPFLGAHLLRFARDGKTLFAADAEGVWVWDMVSRKTRAWLKSYDSHDPADGTFQTMALTRISHTPLS